MVTATVVHRKENQRPVAAFREGCRFRPIAAVGGSSTCRTAAYLKQPFASRQTDLITKSGTLFDGAARLSEQLC
jgi:hypothetical protein